MEEVGITEVKALYQSPPTSHKGENGKLLMVAGSEKYHGAAEPFPYLVDDRVVNTGRGGNDF